jgi:hypothetical protein
MQGPHAPDTGPERQWYIVNRWEEYEGESRANLLRIIGLAAFYAIELCNYHGLRLGVLEMPPLASRPFHLAVTMLVASWLMVCVGVLLCRVQGYFPFGLKYISTCCDLLLLTAILALADGPKSPLLVGYFLILALAGLRFHVRLIWCATAGAVCGYLFLLGYARWFSEGDTRVPRYAQLIFLAGLVLTGVVLGQIVRRTRRIAEDYARRMQKAPGGPP